MIETKSSGGGLLAEPSESFVASPTVAELTDRALAYLGLGYPVHLAGPAGTGKTTLAFHIAAQLGRPVSLIHGNDEFGTGDLIGKDSGYSKSTVVDNYVSSVLKTNEDFSVKWTDNRLTQACQEGHILIYDEFNRTRPEANNILLSIFEEGVLNMPKTGGEYLRVHPDFRVIMTSNPEEYAGVHKTQDALLDRVITMEASHYDEATEIAIASAKSGVNIDIATTITRIARALREQSPGKSRPTIRGSIAFSRVVATRGEPFDPADPLFRRFAWDIFASDGRGTPGFSRDEMNRMIDGITNDVTPTVKTPRRIKAKTRDAA